MRRSGGAAIPMRQKFNKEALGAVSFLLGDAETAERMAAVPEKAPFCDEIIAFLDAVSAALRKHPAGRSYPDIATLGFWLRKASLMQMRRKFGSEDGNLHFGRGTVFHIAPSNVPVNFAYSLAAGLLTGNANIVRIPSRDFPQIAIIQEALSAALSDYPAMKPYICLVRYGRDRAVNDVFSALADVRVVWGGDATIAELRKSPLPPRAAEITFADRYSFAVIDGGAYLDAGRDMVIAQGFYNDTYLSDQNACTSPHLVVWTGARREAAKRRFWSALHTLAAEKYGFQRIMGVNKLTSACLAAAKLDGVTIEPHADNLLLRLRVSRLSGELIALRDKSGFFFEYDCDDLTELRELCLDDRCQTLSFFGDKEKLMPLLKSGIRGIDRIVPIGHTMDFDLIWDGYNLPERLTRTISL